MAIRYLFDILCKRTEQLHHSLQDESRRYNGRGCTGTYVITLTKSLMKVAVTSSLKSLKIDFAPPIIWIEESTRNYAL
jgi:hypothetical protein